MKQIAVLASGNAHKLKEIQAMLSDFEYSLKSLKDVNLEGMEIIEDGDTFEENALIKARAVQAAIGGITIADDSGLEVDALDGAPGVHSARYAGEHGDDVANNKKLIEALSNVSEEKRTARFVSAIAMVFEDGTALVVRGTVEGIIQLTPRGHNGFGYDPYFYYPPFKKTMATMSMDEKNTISHRANALQKLKALLEERNENLCH